MWLVLKVELNPGLLVLMFALILVSAFFSSTETAYSSVGRLRLKTLVELNKAGSKKALWIVDNFDKTLTTLLVGNNLANIGLATVSVIFFNGLFSYIEDPTRLQTVVSLMNTGVMTVIILIFGEIIPKSAAKHSAEKFSLRMSRFIYFLIKMMTPLTFLFIRLNRRVTERIQPDKQVSVTESDLETIIDTMEEEGQIQVGEADMLQSVLALSDISVEEIMTPRVDMIAIEVNDSVKEIKDTFFKNKFSRIPVYDDNIDNIIGVLSERDFYTKVIKKQAVNLRRMVRPALFIPTSTKVDTLITLLQNKNTHLAIVVDEYGGVDGIVTMEDALEELVGEIYDEHDDVIETITKKDDYHYLINADYDLEDLFEDLNLGKPPLSDSTSVGGWLFEMFQDIPEVDEEIEYEVRYNQEYDELSELINEDKAKLVFKILKVKKRRIKSVLMTIKIEDTEE
ncbi:MAG: hemolysin family protein [Candidatus Izemoplasmatales bacterium]|uniref:HlyC/CorC family transporter n=1 Tax=Hujiaoplasma nucleasis TaxID=2725268 RepID=A0A7L6N3X4_9MOLU|nr:hemolysin family protein [Hujiaoplasma nucleasis]QLY39755.1 HlyC/CorC family transporter [Hujiaoplasma nucleasis]